ncbi:hypothetical protein F2Q70_00044537 [Brassica cretica]|uniref:Uncharacterized protein n=1 Tax=Brassica cretica TaxID=69181 RepID=A0A8S9KFI2_BRACR|nr:hypothetical protein F2Q70_00044537 [Brassica cretica]
MGEPQPQSPKPENPNPIPPQSNDSSSSSASVPGSIVSSTTIEAPRITELSNVSSPPSKIPLRPRKIRKLSPNNDAVTSSRPSAKGKPSVSVQYLSLLLPCLKFALKLSFPQVNLNASRYLALTVDAIVKLASHHKLLSSMALEGFWSGLQILSDEKVESAVKKYE